MERTVARQDPDGTISSSSYFLKDLVTARASFGTWALLIEACQSSQLETVDPSATPTIEGELQASFESASENLLHSKLPVEIDAAFSPELTPGHLVIQTSAAATTSEDIVPVGRCEMHQPRETKKQRKYNGDQHGEVLEIEKKKLEYLTDKSKRSKPEDDDLLFLKSLLPYIRRIPAHM